MDAEPPSRIVGRSDNPPMAWLAADNHRLTGQFGPVQFLDRRIKRVHVDVKNHRGPFFPHLTESASFP